MVTIMLSQKEVPPGGEPRLTGLNNRQVAEASASRFATKVALANILHGAVRFSPPGGIVETLISVLGLGRTTTMVASAVNRLASVWLRNALRFFLSPPGSIPSGLSHSMSSPYRQAAHAGREARTPFLESRRGTLEEP